MSWSNVTSDRTRVRDKTLANAACRRCVICGAPIEATFTPNGAKVFQARCPKHPKRK